MLRRHDVRDVRNTGRMTIEVRPATVFDDVATLVGPKNPSSNVCFCLSYRIGSKENVALKGSARADRVRELCNQDPPPGVVAYLDDEPVGWAAVHPRRETSFARNRLIPLTSMCGRCGASACARGTASRASPTH